MAFIGIDTSNYTTSAAIYDGESLPRNLGRPLHVEKGGRGFRQSDAVFAHIKNIPEVFAGLFSEYGGKIEAVGVSIAPRDAKGSYMPCFLPGAAVASALSSVLKVPLYEFSHQAGHVAAAAYGSGHGGILNSDFLAWHLSGGTSELLYVCPSEENIISCKRIGGTLDIAAGQVIDRAGVALGLEFPCGKALDNLSASFSGDVKPAELFVNGFEMSLSGLENKVMEKISAGRPGAETSRFLLSSIYSSICRVMKNALSKYPGLPVLCSGGVMSNSLIRENMRREFGALFAPPPLSADNAAGISILAYLKYKKTKPEGGES